MPYSNLKLLREENVAIVSLSRPDSYNALNQELLIELAEVFKELEVDKIAKVIILQGEGKGFCSGQDLKMVKEVQSIGASEIIMKYYKPAIEAITNNKKPVIGKLTGMAVGAGMSLILASDFIIAEENSSLIPGFVKIGLMPDSGITYFLLKQVGVKRTMEMLATGEKITAKEAEKLGLINKVFKSEDIDKETYNLAKKLAAAPPLVLQSLKKLISAAADADLEEVFKLEARFQEEAAKSQDFKEGVAAFLEKRKPNFKGA